MRKGMIFSHTYVIAGIMFCASLSYNYVSGFDTLTSE